MGLFDPPQAQKMYQATGQFNRAGKNNLPSSLKEWRAPSL
jgi:hypothetical protein